MKVSHKQRARWALVASAVAGAAGVIGVMFLRPRWFMPWVQRNTDDEVLFHVNTSEKVVALTIDDGPHHNITPQALDFLARHHVRATFFLLGSQVIGHEEIVSRIVWEGHEVGNHMMVDERSVLLSSTEFELQLRETDRILRRYAPVKWFRPGSGIYTKQMLAQIQRNGYRCVLGSVYPYDARLPQQFDRTDLLASYAVANTVPGSIIVLHDGRDDRFRLLELLESIVPALKEQGYRFLTLSEIARLE